MRSSILGTPATYSNKGRFARGASSCDYLPAAWLKNLVRFVEEHGEVGQHYPQLLPTGRIPQLPQQVARLLIRHRLNET